MSSFFVLYLAYGYGLNLRLTAGLTDLRKIWIAIQIRIRGVPPQN